MLDKHLIAKTAPAAREENQITLDTVRITVLTERLFRIEVSPEGRFCDQATQAVWFRDLGAVDFRAEEAGEVWSHTRPDGTNFHTVFAQCGLKYTAYGENLFAVNAEYTPAQVLEEWQDSPAHNENLLRENFNGIGVGVAKV